MWNFIFLFGAAVAIKLWLDSTAGEQRRRWQEDHEHFKREIRAHRIKIQNILSCNSDNYDYEELIDLHYHSFRTADQAKLLLDDCQTALDAIGQALIKAREQRDSLKKSLFEKNYEERMEIYREIESLSKLRKALFDDKNILNEERGTVLSEIRFLNSQTHELKLRIRDNTGQRGREWYDRLQLRTQLRNY